MFTIHRKKYDVTFFLCHKNLNRNLKDFECNCINFQDDTRKQAWLLEVYKHLLHLSKTHFSINFYLTESSNYSRTTEALSPVWDVLLFPGLGVLGISQNTTQLPEAQGLLCDRSHYF